MLAAAAANFYFSFRSRPAPPPVAVVPAAAPAAAQFVGGGQCIGCHAAEHAAWAGSQHDRAMQPATGETVLGDFNDATFTYGGVTSTFFARDGKFFVNTDGADGQLADFEISYTFGVEPLQQYLIDFPDGRKQALGIAWDSRSTAAGGQRWFHLYPDEVIGAGDRLHWTAIDQNWNYQCADCHSTNLRKNFDAAANAFGTTWTDIDVNCEACHGPGSSHLAWAQKTGDGQRLEATKGLIVALDERRDVAWTPVADTGNATRSRPRESAREIEVCARCHSRRGQFTDEHAAGESLTEAFRPALLEPGLFHADGQMRDEVYNYASFLQSKMNAVGVTCSDCHEPHSQELRAPGNAICAQCHTATSFDMPAHHHHEPASQGAQCASCHMPTTTYMVIDPRHDHSLRIPRPDLTEQIGTPNACNACHADRTPSWAAQTVTSWFPERKVGFQDFAVAFAGADRGEAAALRQVENIAVDRAEPPIVRASAVARLGGRTAARAAATLIAALEDPDPLVRMAAVGALGDADADTRAQLLTPMTSDPSRLVRMEVARVLAGAPVIGAQLERANAELLAAERFNADRPEAHLALGNFAAARGENAAATAAYEKALEIDAGFSQAAVNLADVHRARGDEARAEATLRAALLRDPSLAAAHHALGLALVRQSRLPEALDEFATAVTLAPAEPRFAYVHAVALFSSGNSAEAFAVLDAALARFPDDGEMLFAAASYRAELGDADAALVYARRLQALEPRNPQFQELVRTLEQRAR